jgi:glycine cleavage system regulatory protein
MATSLVLTVIGPDQPGLVEAISQTVAAHGGSWEVSRMARLAGQFAGILQVSVPKPRAEALFKALHGLEARGLRVTVADSLDTPRDADYRPLALELVGQDRPGIIRDISAALAALAVNVVELHTECIPAPMSGEMLFIARAELLRPGELDVEVLRETLERIAADLMVDVVLNGDAD